MGEVVRIDVEHNLLSNRMPEVRFDTSQTVQSIKEKLYTFFGTDPEWQQLNLIDPDGNKQVMEADHVFGFYAPQNGYRIRVVDLNPHSIARNGGLEDLSQVEKFEMSEEDYDKRQDTFRKFKEKHPERFQSSQPPPPQAEENAFQDLAATMKAGDRCQVTPGDKRGTVCHVGPIATLQPGYWVGVRLDEPVGKNDGTVKGVRVFECGPNYGVIVRPDKVTVGDFPEENFDIDEM
eukprot:gnl/Hemi2/12643_TR4321_c0_g1_i1.p1 gnl/Hemi2/12643_TR4321_c0_g1~~gnl/Hemi2/12643_TR4321_c0_g1_i1.p1  ORF type:complete len:254 (+),score=90.88 gnl/Hemi2/12643_TR4321_c0_g1_i1:62-763(+)